MLSRLWWFVAGMACGIWVAARAFRHRARPTTEELSSAAATLGADLLDAAARAVRANRGNSRSGRQPHH
ncbi:MAG: hypothetical protein ACRDVM_07850 [Acidimicrobiia bacterium]